MKNQNVEENILTRQSIGNFTEQGINPEDLYTIHAVGMSGLSCADVRD